MNISINSYREGILKTAKELVEDTKLLVSGAALNQDQLAGAASKSVATINQLSECIKRGAASLGSDQPEAQVGVVAVVGSFVGLLFAFSLSCCLCAFNLFKLDWTL